MLHCSLSLYEAISLAQYSRIGSHMSGNSIAVDKYIYIHIYIWTLTVWLFFPSFVSRHTFVLQSLPGFFSPTVLKKELRQKEIMCIVWNHLLSLESLGLDSTVCLWFLLHDLVIDILFLVFPTSLHSHFYKVSALILFSSLLFPFVFSDYALLWHILLVLPYIFQFINKM